MVTLVTMLIGDFVGYRKLVILAQEKADSYIINVMLRKLLNPFTGSKLE